MGQSAGQTDGSTENGSSSDTVSSPVNNEPPHEWTREEMLLAQPMPMSGEEREFVFSHKSVQKLHEWSSADYQAYVASPIGRQILFGEAQRWLGINAMLKAQAEFAQDFLAGKTKKPLPLPARAPEEASGRNAGGASAQNGSAQAGAADGADGADGVPGAAAGSSGAYPGEDGGGSTPSMNLMQNLSKEEKFLSDISMLTGKSSADTFARLKKLRSDISKYARNLDEQMKIAQTKGLQPALEEAMNSVEWN